MSTPTRLRSGLRLRSQVCETEAIVILPGDVPVDLRCGGAPMIPAGDTPAADAALDPRHSAGTVLGKRYTIDADSGFEILVTKAGAGSLSNGGVPLVQKQAKPLPASD